MSEESAFKNWISPEVVKLLGSELSAVYPEFNQKKFIKLSAKLAPLELKARVRLIAQELTTLLPTDYPEALKVIIEVIERDKLSGFSLWPFSEFMGTQGLEHFEESLGAMSVLTQKFTSEFAVRPFFLKDPHLVLKSFESFARHSNHHVRRWVSEGSRPLLPWGEKIPLFVREPKHTLPLLELLRYDDELYVRKSVANHLNDISKHHPAVLVATLSLWKKNCPIEHKPKIDWITRHALRTLIKKGDPAAMKLLGVKSSAQVRIQEFSLSKKSYRLGEGIGVKLELRSTTKTTQKLVVDYCIHFVKANGSLSKKVYKWKTFELKGHETQQLLKTHSLRKITTLKFYSGVHKLSVQINGQELASREWNFLL
jgi:3-methyladenine DNA glycosylase AlkC